MRDITLEETIYFNFTTRAFSTGVPTTLGGSPVLSVLESNNATPITSGVSVSVDRASVTGLNQATVVATAANGYEAGKSYAVYISTGTVGGVSVVGEVVAQFTVQSGAAFTRLGAPAGASVSADVAAVKAVLPAALVSGRIDASVGAMAANVMTAAAAASDLSTEISAAVWAESVRTLTAIDEDSTTLDLDATIRSAVGLASANLDTQLDALPTAAENATAVWGAGTRSLTILDEDSTTLDLDATIRAAVGLASANLDTQLDAIPTAAEINAEVDTALSDIRLDELLAADSDIDGAAPPTVGSVFFELMTKTTGSFTYDQTTDSLEALRDNTGSAGAGLTAIPWNASWDAEVQSEVNDGLVAYGVSTATDVTTAAANVSVDEIQPSALADLFNTDSGTTYGSAVAGSVVKEIADNAGGSALTVEDIVNGVWDEALADHLDSGSTGEALNAAGAAGDPWITALPGSYTTGQAGYILGTNLNATVSSRATQTSVDTVDDFLDTEIAAIKAKTDNLPSDPADASDIASAFSTVNGKLDAIDDYVDTEVAAIKAKTDQLQFASGYVLSDLRAIATAPVAVDTGTAGTVSFISGEYVATSGGTVNANVVQIDGESVASDGAGRIRIDTSELPDAAAINAEVVDALNTDTYAEPGQGNPGATISIAAKVGYLYKAWRNKSEQTATDYKLYNDNESTVGQQATVSDDSTTFTRGEMSTG